MSSHKSTSYFKTSLLLTLFMFSGLNTQARLCQKPIVNQAHAPAGYDLTGIGDGCTLSGTYSGVRYDTSHLSRFERRQVERFKDTFHNSCVRHDKCLTEIGNTARQCHDEFHGQLRQSCDSAFKWYQYVDRELCRRTARGFYDVVMRFGTEQVAQYIQSASLQVAYQLRGQVEADQCGSSVHHSGLYSAGINQKIQNTFQSILGRPATPYEELRIATDYNIIFNQPVWENSLVEFARSLQNAPRPPQLRLDADTFFGLTLNLRSDSDLSGIYSDLNGKVYLDHSIGLMEAPRFDQTVLVRGTVRLVGINGAKNLILVERQYRLRGACASRRGQMCY